MKRRYETAQVSPVFLRNGEIFTSGESQTPPDKENELPILPFLLKKEDDNA